jgi:hypothetical protein
MFFFFHRPSKSDPSSLGFRDKHTPGDGCHHYCCHFPNCLTPKLDLSPSLSLSLTARKKNYIYIKNLEKRGIGCCSAHLVSPSILARTVLSEKYKKSLLMFQLNTYFVLFLAPFAILFFVTHINHEKKELFYYFFYCNFNTGFNLFSFVREPYKEKK